MFKKIIAVFILLILPTMGLPHSPLKLSNPKDGASLSKAPTEYKMLFKSPAKLIKFEIFKKLVKSGSIVRAIITKKTKDRPHPCRT